MADRSNLSKLVKYAAAAIAALLIIGVTATTVIISAKRKNVVVIKSNSSENDLKDSSQTRKETASAPAKQEKIVTSKTESTKKARETTKTETKLSTEKAVTAAVVFPLDINDVNVQQLCAIDGIGEATAKSIIDHRTKIGSFASINQLLDIDGIGQKTLHKLKNYLYVKGETETFTTTTETKKTSAVSQTEKPETEASVTVTTVIKYKQVNVNTADVNEISQSLQISEEKAQKIIDMREKIGGYTAKLEVLLSEAITENEFLKLEPYILI